MSDYRKNARELMAGFCRVCPVCNGDKCAGEVPGMGGLGTGASFKANIEAISEYRFNMRVLHDVTDPVTNVEFLGKELSMPVLAAPIGGVSFNMGGKITEEAYVESVLEGCLEKGVLGCTGDGVPPFIHETGFATIKKLNGAGIPFIKPWEDKELFEKLEKAENTGASIVGMDIDAAGLVTLKKMGRPVTPKTPAKLRQIIESTSMKFILKGVMTPEEAEAAVEAGADAIVISNHGGRVLDYTPGTAEVLPEISEVVKGQAVVMVDGGVRSGGDVLKMLALGADIVLIGRPFSIAAVGGLKDGVLSYLDKIYGELIQAMVLTGTADVRDVDENILYELTEPY